MPVIQLKDIQDAANKKFSDFEIHTADEVLYFSPALRLTKTKRRELAAALDIETRAKEDTDDDLFDVYQDAFRISARSEGAFEKLKAAVGDDPAVWQELFISFNEDTQAGEASPSRS